MTIDRRFFLAAMGALGLSACAPAAPRAPASAVSRAALPPDLLPQANAGFDRWRAAFRARALAGGIPARVLDPALAEAGYLPGVVTRDGNQIQTRRSFEDYLSITVSDERLAKGRAALAAQGPTLRAIEARYGVPARITAAIWGIESLYGEKRGQIPVISATATLAYSGRRARFYENQLMAALRLLARGETSRANLRGSWAGAMGHTQFIPTSYEAFAVDFDGDGRRDIWGADPGDALASTAAYLARNGWQSGLSWGAEDGYGSASGRSLTPQPGGPRFTVTRNFDVLKTYNNSDYYALAVGLLSDQLVGGAPLRGSFPPDANGMTKADRIALQRRLAARGYDIGTVDGVIGSKTEAALRDLQSRARLPVTGQPGPETCALLR
ncbi:lytic murein transglycosylase [Poseidonocella sedimentorum]|uniref:Lytic murein transglycosylase n=1 Tax=Poseidonocella sedimentorum TaxID=871652 RepID=A0A1I6DNN1_9RHOB|nr:lytic murein transglycosylase [Poseidonocella sedimentorum]SFR07059.1 lytic murein transglycosylase [Poseidonocella sedimentorum]